MMAKGEWSPLLRWPRPTEATKNWHAMYLSAVSQLGAIAAALGNVNGDPEVSLGMVRELRTDLDRLGVQAARAVRAWNDDPTSFFTESAIFELDMRTPRPASESKSDG
jgi:hypothetical protein